MLNIQSTISYPGLIAIVGVALAIAALYFVYYFRKNEREFDKVQRIVLASLRGISLFLVTLLLLSLLVQMLKRYFERPILVVGIDNSESVLEGHPSIVADVNSFVEELNSELSGKFDLQVYSFGELVDKTENFQFSDKTSDYASFFNRISNQYFNMNLGAVVLLGDGIVNRGNSPVEEAASINTRVYTVGVGDTVHVLDQAVSEVVHNSSVFIGNNFPVQVDLNFKNFEHDATMLEISMGNKVLVSEKIDVWQPDLFLSKQYSVQANEPGLQTLQVRLLPVDGERNVQNNRYRFVIEVHDQKQKILLLSQGPHPDLGAISESLRKHSNFEVYTTFLHAFSGDLSDYDLIVLNQLPSLADQQSLVYQQLVTGKQAVLVIVGPSTSIAALNNLGLNFTMEPSVKYEQSQPFFNPGFSSFTIANELTEFSSQLPPLVTYFTKYTVDSRLSVMAYQRINNIAMDYPLMAFGDIDGRKTGVIFGEGIWRWRMREFQHTGSAQHFSGMVLNMITYLSLKEDREQFKVRYKTIVDEISQVKVRAQLFDDIYEPVIDAPVSFVLVDSTDAEYNYMFDPSVQDYELNLGYLPSGDYRFRAETALGEKQFSKTGSFSVQPLQLESQNLRADYGMLKEIAHTTGGMFFTLEDRAKLIDEIKNNSPSELRQHTEKSIQEVIDWKLIFFILLFLLTMEWFLRKFWGSY